jgi:mannose-6-phosphate isomerase-like protein (cupin superfamily)
MSQSEFAKEPFDLLERHAHFNEDGSVKLIDAATLWSLAPEVMNAQFGHVLVSAFSFSENWATWEMHPHGDEMVYLLSGTATLILRLPQGDAQIALTANRGYMIPKGIWHTAHTDGPCKALFITCGKDTQIASVADMLATR